MVKWVVVLSAVVAVLLLGGAASEANGDVNIETYSIGGGFLPAFGIRNPIGKAIEDQVRAASEKRRQAKSPQAFISSHGYPVEEYKVTTADGYILTLFRIPYGVKNSTTDDDRKPPVFVQHGLMSSAMDFLVTGPDRALGFILADAGYDVWLGNTRGSTYSRQHRDLSPDQKKFWEFSWHEIGERDLPKMINFVLKTTGFKKLHYIGHSQGTTSYFVMCNQVPRMQEKIQTMNALAPIAYMSNLFSPFVHAIAPFSSSLARFYSFTATGEMMQENDIMRMAGYEACRAKSPLNQMCANMIYLMGGYGSNQLDPAQISDLLSYSPASSSIFQLAHYGQEVNTGAFGSFDFGVTQNMHRYNKPTPPEYDPTKVTSRVALHYSENDWLAAIVDVDKLSNKLQNLVGKYLVPDRKFNHMDFCWGKDAKRLVYDRVIGVMRKYPLTMNDRRMAENYNLGGGNGRGMMVSIGGDNEAGLRRSGNNRRDSSEEEEEREYQESNIQPGWGL